MKINMYACDRCGQKYEREEGARINEDLFLDNVKIYIEKENLESCCKSDFCPDCMKFLANWLANDGK